MGSTNDFNRARTAIRRAGVALLGALALAAAGCGDDAAKPEPLLPGTSNSEPGAPEFGDNVVRIPGLSPEDVAAAALLSVYPPEEDRSPTGWVIYPNADWRRAVVGAQFASAPVNAAVLPTERKYFPTPILDVLERLSPSGFPKGEGLEAILLGKLGSEAIVELQEEDVRLTELTADSPADLANGLAPYRGGYAEGYSDTIMVVSSEEAARDYALIAAGWSAFSGDTIAFVDGAEVPEATRKVLALREKLRTRKPTIYVLGPESVVPESAVNELSAYGEVKRLDGESPAEAAVELARYQDTDTGFGFGIKKGPANFTLVNLDEKRWQNAYAAIILAGAGPRAPILPLEDANELPPPVRDYIASLRGKEPNQAFVLGDPKAVASPLVAELDSMLEAEDKKADTQKVGRKKKDGAGGADAEKAARGAGDTEKAARDRDAQAAERDEEIG